MIRRIATSLRSEVEALLRCERTARLFAALLLLGLAYRLDLYSFTFLDRIGPFGLHVGAVRVFRYTLGEPLFAALVCVLCFVLARALVRCTVRADVLLAVVLGAILLVVGFVYGLQRHLLDALNVGLSHELLVEGWGATPLSEVLRQLAPIDLVYTLGPLSVFQMQRLLRERGLVLRNGFMLVALASLLVVGLWARDERPLPPSARAMAAAPVLYVLQDLWDSFGQSAATRFPTSQTWAAAQDRKLRLDDPAFGKQAVPGSAPELSACKARPCSVLVVIMESVGARYVFDARRSGQVPMPYLQQLSQQGLWLSRHHSTNNSSPHSIFSILTGLYPLPEPRMFSTTNRVHVPSLFSLLPASHDSFFYSAGPLKWYFPYGLLRNSGVKEIVDEASIKGRRPRTPTAANELDATDAFVARLARAQPPFLGVYYSYAPHFPYRDYGSEYRIAPDVRLRADRYMNNLRLLDTQLQRIVTAAKKRVPEEELVILLVGDHGEAFGQHRGNWVHLTYSYEENFETPALLLHPSLFPSHVEERPTSHVDLLPTLLDATHTPYDPELLQGVSLLRPAWQRQYLYLYGNENTVSSLSHSGVKVSASFKTGRSRVVDLVRDPQERVVRPVARGNAQLEAVLQYQRFQAKTLQRYNDTAERGEPFFGHRHPAPGAPCSR